MIHAVAEQALAAWGIDLVDLHLVAQRENVVFRVTDAARGRFALRLHRPGYQSVAMMHSELMWMQYLGEQGITVPRPVPTTAGAYLVNVDGFDVDLLTWLDGTPMGATGQPLDLPDGPGTFEELGRLMARVHQVSDNWTPPAGFIRQRWDLDGLLGEAPLWDRFWDNPNLSTEDRDLLRQARARLRADLTGTDPDFGLIHADMLRENVMLRQDGLGLIDFDDSGFGFRLFDVATALIKNIDEPDYAALRDGLLRGYLQVRPLDLTLLPQFMLIRALTYLGWIIQRVDEPGAEVRQARFIKAARPMAQAYLAGDA